MKGMSLIPPEGRMIRNRMPPPPALPRLSAALAPLCALLLALLVATGGARALTLTPDAGWFYDQAPAALTMTGNAPISFTVTGDATLRLTDAGRPGDIWYLFDTSMQLLLATSFVAYAPGFGDDAAADQSWMSASFSSGALMLAPGSYTLGLFSSCNNAAGCPDGVYMRLDSARGRDNGLPPVVPLPATLPVMGGSLLLGLCLGRRRG